MTASVEGSTVTWALADANAGDPVSLVLKTLAALQAHRIPLDLGGLYLEERPARSAVPSITVPTGGPEFNPPVPKARVAKIGRAPCRERV